MRKSPEPLTQLTCRLPSRLVQWLDAINPGNRTYALVQILEAAYAHSSGTADNTPGATAGPEPPRSGGGVGTEPSHSGRDR
jgi:hypothetical protein